MADLRLAGATRVLPGEPKPVVADVGLHVRDRELMVIGGAVGSGKSTLLRMIAGLEPLDAGDLFIGGADVTGDPAARRSVALVGAGSALLPHLSLFENVALPLRLRRVAENAVRARVEHVAALCSILDTLSARPAAVPFETRLRALMACAVVYGPAVVCVDELPAGGGAGSGVGAGVEAGTGSRLRAATVLKQLQRATGVTMLYATRRPADALALGDRLAVLNGGRVRQVGRARAVFDRPDTLAVARFAGPAQISLLRARVVDGRAWLGTLWVTLTANQVAALRGDYVVLGVNPADLIIGRRGPGITATTARVRDMGGYRLVQAVATVSGGPALLEVMHVEGSPPGAGDGIVIGLSSRVRHVFDPVTGRRLPD